MDSADVALTMVQRINDHDVDAIVEMLTSDHVFTDSGGREIEGRKSVGEAWTGYFTVVAEYEMTIEETLASDTEVAMFGIASGVLVVDGQGDEENAWETPAAWRAVVEGDKVAAWHVYADNEPLRALMRRAAAHAIAATDPEVSDDE